ncbi:hypothetical protein KKF61_09215 [Patescibacteria group bacterium]|nr:hypothetical protein [Patescibacteria group bacterium]
MTASSRMGHKEIEMVVCGDCKHFEDVPEGEVPSSLGLSSKQPIDCGLCLRFPPRCAVDGAGYAALGQFPWVHKEMTCGEGKAT